IRTSYVCVNIVIYFIHCELVVFIYSINNSYSIKYEVTFMTSEIRSMYMFGIVVLFITILLSFMFVFERRTMLLGGVFLFAQHGRTLTGVSPERDLVAVSA